MCGTGPFVCGSWNFQVFHRTEGKRPGSEGWTDGSVPDRLVQSSWQASPSQATHTHSVVLLPFKVNTRVQNANMPHTQTRGRTRARAQTRPRTSRNQALTHWRTCAHAEAHQAPRRSFQNGWKASVNRRCRDTTMCYSDQVFLKMDQRYMQFSGTSSKVFFCDTNVAVSCLAKPISTTQGDFSASASWTGQVADS